MSSSTISVTLSPTNAGVTLIISLALLVLLILKEIVQDLPSETARRLNRALTLPIGFLSVFFIATIIFRILHVLA